VVRPTTTRMLCRKWSALCGGVHVAGQIFRPKRPAFAPVPISGILGTLPPELASAIIDALLAQPDATNDDGERNNSYDHARIGAFRSAEDVQHFVRSCRGLLSAFTDAQRTECRARATLFVLQRPCRMLQAHSYTELAYLVARAALLEDLLINTLKMQLFHCARTTHECCRASRAQWNLELKERCDHGTAAMQGYCTADLTVVAADKGATLLVVLSDGGVLVQKLMPMDQTCALVRFSPSKAAEFSPETQHEEVARITETRVVSFVTEHPDGSLLILVERGRWPHVGAFPTSQRANYALTKWTVDGKTVEYELDLGELQFPQPEGQESRPEVALAMWPRGTDELWIAFLNALSGTATAGVHEREQILLVKIDLKEGVVASHRYLPPAEEVLHIGVSRGTGHCAFVDTRIGDRCTMLHYYNTETRRLSVDIDEYPEGAVAHDEVPYRVDAVCLTPDGRSMVVIGHTERQQLMMRTYKCTGLTCDNVSRWTGYPSKPVDARRDWFVDAVLPSGFLDTVTLHDLCMSPCGSKLLLLYTAVTSRWEQTTVTIVDIEKAFASRIRCCRSVAVSCKVFPNKVAWTADGIYVEAKEGGVLRLGLVQ